MAKVCNTGLGNTGNARTPQKTVTKKVIFGNYFDNSGNPNTIYYARPGTVATSSATITGTGTKFTRLKAGDPIMITGEVRAYIGTIASDTSITGCTDANGAAITFAGVTAATYNVFNAGYFTAFINHKDPSRRMYPTPFVKNATDKRAMSITEGFDDQTKVIVNQAIREFNMVIVGKDATPQLAQKLRQGKDSDNGMGIWEFDKDGNIWGMLNTTGQLDQRRIDQNTLDVVYNPGDDKTTPKIMVAFDILSTELDDNIACLAACDTASDVNANIFVGLLDITATYSAITTTGFTVELDTIYGSGPAPITDKGLLKTNYVSSSTGLAGKIYNTSDAADVTVTSVTERLDVNGAGTGIYDVVLPAESSGDSYAPKIVRDGRDYSAVNIVPVVIP